MNRNAEEIFALTCDRNGVIRWIARDPSGICSSLQPGTSLLDLVDPASTEKAKSFLAAVQADGAALDWEMNVPVRGTLQSSFFAGGRHRDEILVIAGRARIGLAECYDQMKRMLQDPSSDALDALQGSAIKARVRAECDAVLLDELTGLNNELANLQRELAKKNVELTRLNEEKNELLGMAAHDLRGPLGIIATYSQLLRDQAWDGLSEDHRDFLRAIHSSSRAMLQLLEGVLDVSAIAAGKLDLRCVPTDLAEVVRQSVELNSYVAARKEIGLIFEPHPPIPLANVDPVRMTQVIDNLLSNAIKYSHRGGHVCIELFAEAGRIMLSVRDTGVGIPPGELARLFKPFSRTSTEATGSEKSTGLGLAIARKIVTAHGGQLQVASEPGKGSTFSLVIPVEESGKTDESRPL